MDIPIIEQRTWINRNAADIFRALTTAEGWNSWFTSETEFKIINGAEYITLVWTDWGAEKITLRDGGRIVRNEPNKTFAFEWTPAKDLTTTVQFELEEEPDGTYVTVTETGYNEQNLNTLVHCAAGWGEALTIFKVFMEHGIKVKP